MKILESIDKFANTERVAVKCLDKELSYKQLREFSDKIATFLLEVIHDTFLEVPLTFNCTVLLFKTMTFFLFIAVLAACV